MAFENTEDQKPSNQMFEDKVVELSGNIDRLKVLYEQYFLGRERIAPQSLRENVDRDMRYLKANLNIINNTALKFKINGLQAKLISFRRHWDRTMQQIEDGTYQRHRFKVKINTQKETEAPPANKTKSKAPTTAKKNANIEKLMGQFIAAKKKCNESVTGINYEKFAKTITSQSAALKKQYQCKSVKFKVVIEGGKPKLKASPK